MSRPTTATPPIRAGGERPALRIRRALVAAFALACFAAPTAGNGQPQPGEPTTNVPLADPAQSVAVEIAMSRENGAVVCRPDRARLPAGEELTLQLVNGAGVPVAFAAPEFFEKSLIASLVGVAHDRDRGLFVVEPGVTGQIVFKADGVGEYAFGCAALGEDVTATGTIVVPE